VPRAEQPWVLDGNAVAGALEAAIGEDATTAIHTCSHCRRSNPVGRHLLYRGAGCVLRCPDCGAPAITLVERPGAALLRIAGVLALPVPD
jgi:hypothetical protein